MHKITRLIQKHAVPRCAHNGCITRQWFDETHVLPHDGTSSLAVARGCGRGSSQGDTTLARATHPTEIFSLINKQTSRVKRIRDQRGSNVCRDTAGTSGSDPSNGYYSRSLSLGTGPPPLKPSCRVGSSEKGTVQEQNEKKNGRKGEKEKEKKEERKKIAMEEKNTTELLAWNHVRPWEGKTEGIKLVTFGIKVARNWTSTEIKSCEWIRSTFFFFFFFNKISRRMVIGIKEWICED